ncbi:MAG TPA: hypothetical protein VJI32_02830 [Candidatus Nanoarchaeia archaeon]|nr:hypothetical protein [Candidatus Nanoarchaeia archaeon]
MPPRKSLPRKTVPRSTLLSFKGKGWQLLGWGFVYILFSFLIIPVAWAMQWLCEWFARNLRFSDRNTASFQGKGKDVWVYFVLIGAIAWIPHLLSVYVFQDARWPTILFGFLLIPLDALLMLPIIRWFFANIKCTKNLKFNFHGNYAGYLGWMLLANLSVITIIGWAWAAVGMQRWIYQNVKAGSSKLVFQGTGWGLLWRSILAILGSVLLVTIPWMVTWILKWYVKNTVVVKK